MYILKTISEKDKESIKEGNKALLKRKLESEYEKWHALLLLSKEDQRFHQGICCSLLDILDLI
jgi:hypothetical protein